MLVKKEKANTDEVFNENEVEEVLKEDCGENDTHLVEEPTPDEETTSLENVERAISVIQDKVTKLRFENCIVTGFTQKATNTKVTLNSADFEVTVTIKDNERWGL